MYGPLRENFQFVELSEIMRQRYDKRFTDILNRIRTENHTPQDIEEMKLHQVRDKYPNDNLHDLQQIKMLTIITRTN